MLVHKFDPETAGEVPYPSDRGRKGSRGVPDLVASTAPVTEGLLPPVAVLVQIIQALTFGF